MSTVQYETLRDARAHMTDITNRAASGRPVAYARDHHVIAAVDADRLRDALAALHPARAEVFTEGRAVGIAISELGLAVEGDTFEDAVAEMTIALRDYADDWADHLRLAGNHAKHWGVVQIIAYSSDEQLAEWVKGA
ncbi:MAG: hypothetical protein QM619_01760 [Micropruina sp.]|uniref:hypothetical protein n=1 Tax=Micropruina sp. TaxID=2737536 RepID=UPI0039E434A9